ncbi:MAG: hypothetical protein ACRDYA_09380 [Egibacteraceae bacterium]
MFEGIQPRGLRRYQASIAKQVGAEGAHIAMPECAGGPVVGVELIRRLRRRAVVFAPTVAAQLGWQDELARCTDAATITGLSTLDPRVPAPITLLSYCDLQTAETATALLSDLVVDAWAAELVTTGQARDEAAARARIERGRAHNPRKFDRTLARRHAQLTATLLHGPQEDLGPHLSPMTRHLIEALVAGPVRVIVLDACDQLRDGWAVALRYLAHRIATENGPPIVIGLSTVPHSVPGAHRYCRRLIGGQDVSPPAPALVHEGAIAPYRDLVHFVPTRPEKARAAAEILAREQAARPERLRAAALTEREADGWDVLGALLADEHARGLDPVLITRDGLAVESNRADSLLTSCAGLLRRLELHACCRTAESTMPGVRILVGKGPDWTARTMATLAARALDSGMTRCLVSTVGQSLHTGELDTLVDLTTRPTVTTAKLRDRALRLDESFPGKVAHIWHVVASSDRAEVQRLTGQDRWGLALTEPRGRTVRGPAALDYNLASGAFGAVDYRWLTIRCLAEIGDRKACRRQWAQGKRQSIGTVASIDAARIAQPRGLRELLGWLALPLLLAALLVLLLLGDSTALGRQVGGWVWLAARSAELAIAALTGVSALWAWQVLEAARGSVESRLLVLGHAVLDALRDSGHIDPHMRTGSVRIHRAGQRYEITLKGGSRRDAEVFATALAETLSPPRGQPHVVAAGSHRIPVPRALSREPQLFLRAWRRHGGVGRLADGPPASARQGAVAFEVWDVSDTRPPGSVSAGPAAPIDQPRRLDQPARPAHEPLVPVDGGEPLGRHAQV